MLKLRIVLYGQEIAESKYHKYIMSLFALLKWHVMQDEAEQIAAKILKHVIENGTNEEVDYYAVGTRIGRVISDGFINGGELGRKQKVDKFIKTDLFLEYL